MGDLSKNIEEDAAMFKARARRLFKAAIRRVLYNLEWIREELEERTLGIKQQEKGEIEKAIQRQISSIIFSKDKYSFTFERKYLLMSNVESRTKDILKKLSMITEYLPFFKGYPEEVRKQLTYNSNYVFITADRKIIEAGQLPQATYCLLDGEVEKSHMGVDPVTNEPEIIVDEILKPPAIFEEMASIKNIPLLYTYKTKSSCDFLVIENKRYNDVLEKTIKSEWESIIKSLQYFPQFQDWDDVKILECARKSRIERFKPSQTILGDGFGTISSVYFLMDGLCQLIHDLHLTRINQDNKIRYKLESSHVISETIVSESKNEKFIFEPKQIHSQDLKKGSTIEMSIKNYKRMKQKVENMKKKPIMHEIKYLEICKIRKGHIFNIGEDLSYRRIVALEDSSCICIPRTWLIRQNADNRWLNQKTFLETRIPNDPKQIFKQYQNDQKWIKYKRDLVNGILKNRKLVVSTTIHDVPYAYRIKKGKDIILL